MSWRLIGIVTACLILLGVVVRYAPADARPIYAVRSVHACDTCHVEPVGWANPEVKKRKCSLDCAICHVSPTGGGLRTPSGQFYGREVLPRWGHRPSEHATSDDNAETVGYYSVFGGFGGWQAGDTPAEEIEDRYGNIEPNPKFRAGGDIRLMTYAPFDEKVSIFPMQGEAYFMGRPHKNLVLYADVGITGYRGGTNLLGLQLDLPVFDYFRVRELFIKVDQLPYNSYVRIGRFNPAYGWRIPDHTAFIRRNIGFDQNRQVFGIEGGINPNYPYVNAAVFVQGLSAWPGDSGEGGWGATLNGGVRELGWHLGGSAQFLSNRDSTWNKINDELTLGPQWAVNLYPVVLMGELDFKQNFTDKRSTLAGYTEVNWLMTWGVSSYLKLEYIDTDLSLKDDHKNRIGLGTNFHPWTFVDVNLEYRQTWQGGTVFLINSELTQHELLFMVHTWF